MSIPIPGQEVIAEKARVKTRLFAKKLDRFMFRSWMLTLIRDAPHVKGVDVEARKAKKTLGKLLRLRMTYVCYESDAGAPGGVKQIYQYPYSSSPTQLAIEDFKEYYSRDQKRADKWMKKIAKLRAVVRKRYPDLGWDTKNKLIDPIEDEKYEAKYGVRL